LTPESAYLAAEGRLPELLSELGETPLLVLDRLVLSSSPPRPLCWAQNVWEDPRLVPFASISGGANALRALQRNWALYPVAAHRRAALIESKLPPLPRRPLPFPSLLPRAPMGSWTLLDERTLLAAPRCSSPFPHGEVGFVEDREGPPNRAYLKLWEALTLLGEVPRPGERCLDLGSSPGGWTWALARLGATVVSVDKAPLDPGVAAMEGVTFRQQSAFSVDPAAEGAFDWLFCDVVCYPARLLALVRRWREAAAARRFVCTLKFQGETDHAAAAAFAALPGARLVHLHHNKHELTLLLG